MLKASRNCHGRRSLTNLSTAAIVLSIVALTLTSCSSTSSNNTATGAKASTTSKGNGASSKVLTVKVGQVCQCAAEAPLFVGQEQGIFKKYGLNIQTTVLTPSAAAAAVVNGNEDFAGDGGTIASAIIKTGDAKAVFNRGLTPFYIALRPGQSTSFSTLRGKTVASTTPGSTSDDALESALQQNGLTPKKDVNITFVSNSTADLAAVEGGTVQGAVLTFPQSAQAAQKGSPLLNITKYGEISIEAVNAAWAKAHPQGTQAFIKAYAEACRLTLSNEQDAETALVAMGAASSSSQAKAAWQVYRTSSWAVLPISNTEAMAISQSLKPASSAQPSTWVDNSFIDSIGSENYAQPK